MSNLSDLLPAGAGAKSATFTASGTLATGQTVILNSDGTVSAVASTGGDPSTGTAVVFEAGALPTSPDPSLAFDSSSNKVVISYRDEGNSGYGTAIVGTVSGTSISFGTPVVFESASTFYTSATFDSSANKTVIAYKDSGNSGYGTAVVGTVSGTSISFGSPTVFESANSLYISATFDSNANKIVIAYRDTLNSDYGTAIVGTVSGTSISFGSPAVFESAEANYISATFDANENKVVIAYTDVGNSNYGTAVVGTVSGTSISFGTPVVFESATSYFNSITFDSNSNKVVSIYKTVSPYTVKGIVGTVSGTSISFGSSTSIALKDTNTSSVTYDSFANKVVAFYNSDGDSYVGSFAVGTVSGTSISFGTPVSFTGVQTYAYGSIFDSNANKVVVAYTDVNNSFYGTAAVVTTSTSTNTGFVGITDEAIANAATGSVVVEGGVITNSALVPFSVSSVGTPVVFNAGNTSYGCAAYDSSNNKVVIAYKDRGNSDYGTAIVGTVSGTSISFGSEVVFSTATTDSIGIAFDSSNNKVVIVYKDTTASNAVAIVGTVSGTSISFGSPTTYDSGNGNSNGVAYDSNAQKLVVVYQAISNSNYATAIVGTVSGTSISFGSSVVYESASSSSTDVTYDSDSQKVICTCRDAGNSNKGTAIVGTVSGTSISFGSPAVFSTGGASAGKVAYDATAQKVVVVYRDEANSYSGAANVGTVSGTSISFGATVNFTNSVGADYPEVEYDPSGGGVVVTYTDGGNGDIGKTLFGTVSGTSISFTDAITYESSATYFTGSVYDANAQKMVAISKDGGNSNYGTAAVLTTSASLTTGSTYYVQDDGSLSTTSSSVTAGKALSSTTLLLKG